MHVDVLFVIEFNEFSAHELSAIIHDDGIHDTISIDDLIDELNNFGCHNHCNGLSLEPLNELVDSHKEVVIAPRCRL